jgi:hypothetical protein
MILDPNMEKEHECDSPPNCRLCGSGQVEQLLDFGPQPICNRFLASPTEAEAAFPLSMGQCRACGIVQSVECPPASELRPRVDWITYNEPEGHLDDLANTIAALPGLPKDRVACGISFKDDSLLRRLRERGFSRTWRLDPEADLGVGEAGVGVETIQDRLDAATASKVAAARGMADVVIARHIWEHTFDSAEFLRALQGLLSPGGYLVLEVPDCERALTTCDYTTVWEEHTLYFTPATFHSGLLVRALSLCHYECVPYSLENSLIAAAQPVPFGAPAATVPRGAADGALAAELHRGQVYSAGLAVQRERLKSLLDRCLREEGKVALLGAGHLACTFINLLGLEGQIDCLVDDNPHKCGMFMPGSRLPIYPSSALVERNVRLCLLSVNPESEDRVMERNGWFLQAGGRFASIFPASKYALK